MLLYKIKTSSTTLHSLILFHTSFFFYSFLAFSTFFPLGTRAR